MKKNLTKHIEFHKNNAEILPFKNNSFDMTMSATIIKLLDTERMLRKMVRITQPDKHVGIIMRAIDIQSFINIPMRAELKMKITTLPNELASARKCTDGNLYQHFHNANLQDIQMLPQLTTYTNAHTHTTDERIEAALSPAELTE